LKEFVSRKLKASFYHPGETPAVHFDIVKLSRFAFEMELESCAFHFRVIGVKGGKSERIIFPGICFVSHSNEGCLKQPDY
jgi:hypothetical protein